jgi:two-component system response regulator DevR
MFGMSKSRECSDTPQESRPRVLLVDDHREILVGLRRFLGTSCEIVGEATNGHAALKAATVLNPDVVVLDLNLPEMDGLEVCRRIRKAQPQIQVVILTAGGDDYMRKAALDAGASDLVLKHLVIEDLLNAILDAVRGELSRGPT